MDAILKASLPKLREKLLEALQAVLPIVAIVLVLCFTIAPVSPSILLCFLLGAVLIVVGIMFFTLGAEMSMAPMGERVGAVLTRSRKLPVILGVGFLLGFLITISEPDLQLAAFVPREFLAVAFDSGGVTTGPMTVPFIMALGVGVSAIRGDRHAADDSFGLVALCSIGPILAVMILSMIFKADSSAYTPPVIPEIGDSKELFLLFARELPAYMKEIAAQWKGFTRLYFQTKIRIYILHRLYKVVTEPWFLLFGIRDKNNTVQRKKKQKQRPLRRRKEL